MGSLQRTSRPSPITALPKEAKKTTTTTKLKQNYKNSLPRPSHPAKTLYPSVKFTNTTMRKVNLKKQFNDLILPPIFAFKDPSVVTVDTCVRSEVYDVETNARWQVTR